MILISGRRDDGHTPARPAAGAGARAPRWRISVVPGSRAHRWLLAAGLAGSVLFNATFLLDGTLRPGYDWLAQPMSALSLGPAGWVQITNFIIFGALTCCSAPGWRATLAPGAGAVWYPRLKVVAGLMLITAGVFSQDPGLGFPPGVPAPASATLHAQIHNVAAVASLGATIAGVIVLGRRLRREPRWRGWGSYALVTAGAMIVFLAAFGSGADNGDLGGLFEKLASITAGIFSAGLVTRLLTHDARLAATAPGHTETADAIMTGEPAPPTATGPPRGPGSASTSPWSWWLVTLVVAGALLTATGAVLALLPASGHLSAAGQDYAGYFATRNLAMAVMLLIMLALRAQRVLAGLMTLTALIQTLDAITASATGRLGLVPIDLAFTAAFLIGAARLSPHPVWRAATWRER